MNKELFVLHTKFQSIMQLSLQLDKSPKRFGTDELLTHSEIHFVEIVGDNPGLSVTDLSKHLSITKGAVSQGLKRLESKGYIWKKSDPENLSRSMISLTSKGQTAYWAHKHWHETMDGGFLEYLENLSNQDYEVIVCFLDRVEDFLNRRIQSLE